MREILFRGKTAFGAWVHGDLIHRQVWKSKFEVIRIDDNGFDNYTEYEVATETIGQFTGLTDKKGKKIFEGDIIEWFAQGESEHPDFGYIEYDEQSFAWRVCWQKYDPDWLEGMQSQYITVIGNIFDNKDLLS